MFFKTMLMVLASLRYCLLNWPLGLLERNLLTPKTWWSHSECDCSYLVNMPPSDNKDIGCNGHSSLKQTKNQKGA